jgi:hypothetical protein
VSRLLDARARILAALEAASIRTATTGKLSAPCVHVEPGDPWTEPARLPGRTSRWQLRAIAGRADSEGSYAQLGELVDLVDTALRTIDGCQLPSWAKPTDYTIDGVPYAASVATVQLASS